MTAILELHPLSTAKRAGELSRLVERMHRDGIRVVVWVEDPGRRLVLDDYLWTFDRLAFVPHLSWSSELGEVEDPVVLVSEAANPNRAEVLVVADGFPPADWAASFRVVHDLIPPGTEGEERSGWWRRWQHEQEEQSP